MWANKRYWLIGASEGLGRALAEELSAAGAELALSARSEARLAELARALPGPAEIAPLDVTDLESCAAAYRSASARPLDGAIYLAGAYEPMRAQEWDTEAALKIAEVNFMGAIRALGPAIPDFTARGAGLIGIVGSLAGFRGLPGAIGYGASKAGVMHLAETLHMDLEGSGVAVRLVNPGFIRTRLTAKNDFKMPFIMAPEEAARQVRRGLESARFQTNFPRLFSWWFRFGQLLPMGLWRRAMT